MQNELSKTLHLLWSCPPFHPTDLKNNVLAWHVPLSFLWWESERIIFSSEDFYSLTPPNIIGLSASCCCSHEHSIDGWQRGHHFSPVCSVGVQGFLSWVLIGGSIHTLGWRGRNWGLQAGCCKGKYNQQLKIDIYFLCKRYSLYASLFIVAFSTHLYPKLEWVGFLKAIPYFLPFPASLFSQNLFILHSSQWKLTTKLKFT